MDRRVEREFWQAVVNFSASATVPPSELAALFAKLDALLPVPAGAVQWTMPALQGGTIQFEVTATGAATAVSPDLLVGVSAETGWMFQMSTRQLVVRHQEFLSAEPPYRRRAMDRNSFPDRRAFSEVVQGAINALPPTLVAASRRTSLSCRYALFTGDVYPASLLAAHAGKGSATKYPPRDGVRYISGRQELEFETIAGRRYAWNGVTSVGNWFAADGRLLHQSALLFGSDIATALPEPEEPRAALPTVEDLRPLAASDVKGFFSHDGPVGPDRMLNRLRALVPAELEIDE